MVKGRQLRRRHDGCPCDSWATALPSREYAFWSMDGTRLLTNFGQIKRSCNQGTDSTDEGTFAYFFGQCQLAFWSYDIVKPKTNPRVKNLSLQGVGQAVEQTSVRYIGRQLLSNFDDVERVCCHRGCHRGHCANAEGFHLLLKIQTTNRGFWNI